MDAKEVCSACGQLHEDADRNHVFTYSDEINEEYCCSICLSPICQPIDAPCGHTFCAPCIESCIHHKKLCPNCRKPLTVHDLRPSAILVRNILDKLRVYCPNCNEVLARVQLEPHLAVRCPETLVSCTHTELGCTERLPRKDILEHNEACTFKQDPKLVIDKQLLAGAPTLLEIIRTPGDKLGLTIFGGTDTHVTKIMVQDILPGGICDIDQRLRIGDYLLEVNGCDLRRVTHKQAFQLLDRASSPIKLLVLRNTNNPNPISQRFCKELEIEPHTVELQKTSAAELGIRIMSTQREPGVKVLNLIEDSTAAKSGLIKQNDRILNVNGVCLQSVSQQTAADIIKSQTGKVRFLIHRLVTPTDAGKIIAPFLSSLVSFKTEEEELEAPRTVTLNKVMHDYIGFSVVGGMGSVLGDVPVMVIFVAPNSCAEKAGIKVGDMITHIEERPLSELSYHEVLMHLRNADTNSNAVKLTVQSLTLDKKGVTPFSSDWPFSLPSHGFGKLSTAHIQRHITNSSASLGFRIVGGKGSHQGDLPVVIKSISSKSLAAKSMLRSGDHVVGCNGKSVLDMTHEDAAQLIKNTRGDVLLTVLTWPECTPDRLRPHRPTSPNRPDNTPTNSSRSRPLEPSAGPHTRPRSLGDMPRHRREEKEEEGRRRRDERDEEGRRRSGREGDEYGRRNYNEMTTSREDRVSRDSRESYQTMENLQLE